MKNRIKFAILSVSLCILASCSPIPCSSTTLPQDIEIHVPQYITSYDRLPRNDGDICLHVSQEHLWESSDPWRGFTREIIVSAQLLMDGQEIDKKLVSIGTFNWTGPVFRDNKVVGIYDGDVEFCIDTRGVPNGVHKVEIAFTTLPEKQYSFSWEMNLCR